jgi:hypothetical protein
VALGLSIVGVRRDRRRLLSLVTLLVSGAFTILFLASPGDVMFVISAMGR